MSRQEALQQFRQALKDNGLDDVIAETQRQLDAFLAENGK